MAIIYSLQVKKREVKVMLDCFKCLKKIDAKKTGIFAAGVLFGTAGIKILSSKDAKRFTETVQQQYFVQRNA